MENHEIDKAFWVDKIRVPDKDGNHMAGYTGRIKVALGKPKIDGGDWKMEFKTVLPDYMHEKLLDKSVLRIRDRFKGEPELRSYNEFKKTVVSYSLESLLKRFNEIVDDFLFIVNDENMPKEKTIYVKWKHVMGETRSSGNSAKMGKKAEFRFNFFIGYFNGQSHYDIDHKAFNTTSYDKEVLDYMRIPWTQEREDFFEKVYANFESLRDKLDAFFSGCSAKTIDSYISNFKMIG